MSEFEHTVLDKIEQSPTGAVPHTPAYQDALAHLRATHQVYPSADYKAGYVTVRSLAARPIFYAQNMEACVDGKVGVEGLEADASIFSRYVASLPAELQAKAEACRALVVARKTMHRANKGGAVLVHDPLHTLFLVPGGGPKPGLPGNYLYGSMLEGADAATGGGWSLLIHDHEDGAALCEVASQAEALAKLQDVLASAPFQLEELASLGFRTV